MDAIKLLLIGAGVFALAAGCKKDPVTGCFVKYGDSVISERPVTADFHAVHVYGHVDVEIVQESEYSVRVISGEHVEQDIVTRIENDILTIDDESNCRFVRNFKKSKVIVTLPEIDEIGYYGNGVITSRDTLKSKHLLADLQAGGDRVEITVICDFFEARVHASSCDLIVKGRTNHFGAYKRGLGKIRASELRAITCYLESFSATDSEVWATSLLDYRILYKGNIYYRGDPEVNHIDTSGEGQLIRIEP